MIRTFLFIASDLPNTIYELLKSSFQRNSITEYYVGYYVNEVNDAMNTENVETTYCMKDYEDCKIIDAYFNSILTESELIGCDYMILLKA